MTLKKAFKKILDQFEGDYEKTLIWFSTKNNLLDNVAPLVMISRGEKDKFCKVVDSVLNYKGI